MSNKPAYQWIPRKGFSLDAIERMRKHFNKPENPMGEAWFIGKKRRLYTELNNKIFIKKIKPVDLSAILFEISSGTNSFGHREEWNEWFKYLLPDLIIRSQDFKYFSTMLVQDVITAFISIYWKGIVEEYEGFRNDVINSLSLCLMNDNLWFDYNDEKTQVTSPRPIFLDCHKDGKEQLRLDWNAGQADENFSAMMFFCLKYFKPEEIISWLKSVFLIQDIYWKGAFMIWLLGAYDILQEPIIVPSKIEKGMPKISWMSSHLLCSRYGSIDVEHPPHQDFNDNKDFLPSENIKVFFEEIHKQITDEVILDWAESFADDKLVAESTFNVPKLLSEKLSN